MFDAANIEPVYQPIFDLRDGSVVGYEALARGRGGNGLASPEALFAAAREQGRVAELDRACREAALAGAVEAAWARRSACSSTPTRARARGRPARHAARRLRRSSWRSPSAR